MYIKHLQQVAETLKERHDELNSKMAAPPPEIRARRKRAAEKAAAEAAAREAAEAKDAVLQGRLQAAEESGTYRGSEQDRADGFLHFSTAEQIVESARRHRAGEADLLLLRVKAEPLGEALRWEESRGGALFPHLYGDLDASAVDRVDELRLGDDGEHVFPADSLSGD